MNAHVILDVFVLGIMIFFGIKSIPNGFIRELFGFIGIVFGAVLASSYNSEVAIKLIEVTHINNAIFMSSLAFLLVFLIFWLTIFLLSLIASKMINLSGMGIFDKLFGSIVGALKIFLFLSIVVYMLLKVEFIKEKSDTLTEHTLSFPILFTVGTFLMNTDSDNISEDTTSVIDNVTQIVKEKSNDTKELIQNGATNLQNAVEKKLDDISVNDEENYIQDQMTDDLIDNTDIENLK
jgi:membrane protein required for colicin V production